MEMLKQNKITNYQPYWFGSYASLNILVLFFHEWSHNFIFCPSNSILPKVNSKTITNIFSGKVPLWTFHHLHHLQQTKKMGSSIWLSPGHWLVTFLHRFPYCCKLNLIYFYQLKACCECECLFIRLEIEILYFWNKLTKKIKVHFYFLNGPINIS